MASDIVERLRGDLMTPYQATQLMDEAADEIERLRAALKKIDLLNTPLHGWAMSDLIDQEIVASGVRAALSQEPPNDR